jgi:hypothetical protein
MRALRNGQIPSQEVSFKEAVDFFKNGGGHNCWHIHEKGHSIVLALEGDEEPALLTLSNDGKDVTCEVLHPDNKMETWTAVLPEPKYARALMVRCMRWVSEHYEQSLQVLEVNLFEMKIEAFQTTPHPVFKNTYHE